MKLKRILSMLLALTAILPLTAQARDMSMYVGGNYVVRDVQSVEGFDMLPVLDIAGELGYAATFNGTTALLSNGETAYRFTLGSPAVYDQNGKEYGLDVVPQMINGRFMIPASFFTNALGMSYFWDNVTDSIFLDADNAYNWLITTSEYKEAKRQLTGPVTMYAADGRTASVPKSEVAAWQAVGWYTEPFCNVYAMDGRVESVPKSEVAAWVAVGWFDSNYVTMYSPYGEKESVHVWSVPYWLKEDWYLEPIYAIYDARGNELRYTKSDVERGAYYTIDDAITIAQKFCKTHMPITEDDIYDYAYWYEVPASEVRSWVDYEGSLMDFNGNCYLISIDYLDVFLAISVNKYTGEAKYCGGGQDYYMRGDFDF